ncbi:hypothetical protein ACF0H5_018848 [Mactra antiquata]
MAEQPVCSIADTGDQTDVNETDINEKQDNIEETFVETQPEEFCTKTCPADLTLMVEDRPLLVSKILLGTISLVFDAMFSENFKENNLQTVKLPGKKFNDFVEFMRCANPHTLKPITLENVFGVLPLAHEYQVKYLFPSCEVTLIKFLSNDTGKELFNLLKLAFMYNLDNLTAKCIEKAAERPLDEIEDAGRRHELDINTTNAIKSQMLTNLTTKHRDFVVDVTTSQAMYRYLGLKSRQLGLVKAFRKGIVFGDYKKVKVYSDFKKSIDMCICGDNYSIKMDSYNSYIRLHIRTCKYFEVQRYELNCYVSIKNFINPESNKYVEKHCPMRNSGEFSFTLTEMKVNVLTDKSAGYITELGVVNFELYLFIVDIERC